MKKNEPMFESYTFIQWQQLVESTLKGKKLNDLHTSTYEGITLKPLYTERPAVSDEHPSRWWSLTEEWHVAQQINADSPEEAVKQAEIELSKGSDVIAFKHDGNGSWSKKQLEHLFSLQKAPHLFLVNKSITEKWTPFLVGLKEQHHVQGVFGYDFISGEAVKGQVISQDGLEKWVSVLHEIAHAHPALKTIVISTVPYHHAGANAVQELAYSLAEAAWMINHLAEDGWQVEDIVSKMHIQFATGSAFFLEIAKLRAFRALWSHFIECYTVGDLPVSIGSESSPLTKTVQDPHVNLLRAGNEAFAAALGGVNYQHVEPYSSRYETPGPLAVRLARNIQLILKEETFLKGIFDPGGGSYYIESLTKQLADEAWSTFIEIEEKGGIQETLSSGLIQQNIEQVWLKRKQDNAVRKNTIVGTNRYAPLEKITMPSIQKQAFEDAITPLPIRSNGEDWEALVSDLQQKELPPVDVICLGQLKEYKPRLDFIQGICNTIGIKTINRQSAGSSPVQIICGKDKDYEDVEKLLQTKKSFQSFYVAGKVSDGQMEQWRNAGLHDSVYEGKNLIEFLVTIVKQLEEVKSNETGI